MSSKCDKPYTSNDKWVASVISGLLFLLLASPFTYTITNSVTSGFGLVMADSEGCPNIAGILVHAVVFTVLLRLLMNKDKEGCPKTTSDKDKWIISAMGGLLFVLVSSPFLYNVVNSLTSSLGFEIADSDGCPNTGGVVLHAAVFVLITRLFMR